jgi:hypothetical protein
MDQKLTCLFKGLLGKDALLRKKIPSPLFWRLNLNRPNPDPFMMAAKSDIKQKNCMETQTDSVEKVTLNVYTQTDVVEAIPIQITFLNDQPSEINAESMGEEGNTEEAIENVAEESTEDTNGEIQKRQFFCTICDPPKTYTKHSSFQQHYRDHFKKEYNIQTCIYCNKSFARKQNKNQHQKVCLKNPNKEVMEKKEKKEKKGKKEKKIAK